MGAASECACILLLFVSGLLQYDTDESEDTTVTEDADFSLILNGAELEFASYTYASEDG